MRQHLMGPASLLPTAARLSKTVRETGVNESGAEGNGDFELLQINDQLLQRDVQTNAFWQ